MPRKKEILEGYEDAAKLTVQKSLPLFSLWHSKLTLSEFKILDLYLSRINSHVPEKRTVLFSKGEIEKILGVTKINKVDLKERLTHLMSEVVELPSIDFEDEFTLVTLFESAGAERDETGLWQIKLKASQDAMKYFFNIESIGYVRYKLQCITSLKSRYSYIMFTYLEHNRFRKAWNVKIETLKEILDCSNEETYKEYKYFNNLVLKKIYIELTKETKCRYTYTPIKRGRVVVAIHFELEDLSNDNAIDMDTEFSEYLDNTKEAQNTELWQEPLETLRLSEMQMEEIYSILVTIPKNNLPTNQASYGNLELMRYHYLDQKVKEIMRRDAQRKINNKFAYLLKILKEDINPS